MSHTRLAPLALLAAVFLLLAACGGSDDSDGETTDTSAQTSDETTTTPTTETETDEAEDTAETEETEDTTGAADGELASTAPAGTPISEEEVAEFKALFDDEAYVGGQEAPRLVKWITPDSYLFVQFDAFDPAEGNVPLFLGLGVKGVFCSEAQPDGADGSFTHFHQPSAAAYGDGHGGAPGTEGYWLSFLALAEFDAQGRLVVPGVDYELAPTPPPDCGDDVPDAEFAAPGEQALSADDLAAFVSFFDDPILDGGQVAPRFYKSINEDVSIFIQLNAFDPAEATTISYVGLSQRGVFCDAARPSPDFTHYHRHFAAEYADGHGGPPGESEGYWLAFVATHDFELLFPGQDASQARDVAAGIDREFALMDAPACPEA